MIKEEQKALETRENRVRKMEKRRKASRIRSNRTPDERKRQMFELTKDFSQSNFSAADFKNLSAEQNIHAETDFISDLEQASSGLFQARPLNRSMKNLHINYSGSVPLKESSSESRLRLVTESLKRNLENLEIEEKRLKKSLQDMSAQSLSYQLELKDLTSDLREKRGMADVTSQDYHRKKA